VGGTDSNPHATSKDDRKSIMSKVHTLGGCYIMSTLKIPSVTLSCSESEHYSNLCAAMETKVRIHVVG
jgi:hypothetical protein